MKKRRYQPTFIRAWREYRGLSLRGLADRLEMEPGGEPFISHASIGRIEQGTQPYSQPILEALAQALDCEVRDLLSRDPTKDGDVVDLLRHLPDEKREQAEAYLRFLSTG